MRRGLLFCGLLLAACDTSDSEDTDSEDNNQEEVETDYPTTSCVDYDDPCVEIAAGDSQGLLETANLLEANTTIVLAEGTYALDNQVTFRDADGVSLIGQGMDLTTLDFSAQPVQTNGVDAISDGFLLEGLTILNAKKDGVRVEDSEGITFRAVRVTWTDPESPENGAYGLYPVSSTDVLIEDCEAFNAADAGIYVGQVQRTVVRNNLASGNVAGIEIENTQYADVYGNTATNNTGGLLIFDLPGNPIIGRDVWVHDNTVTDNNTPNFAPSGVVSTIPAGTGTVILASRRVVLEDNTYANNNTSDIAILSGLIVEGDAQQWVIPENELVGDVDGLTLDSADGVVFNFRTRNIVLANNSHANSGTEPDVNDLNKRELGFLLGAVYKDVDVDSVLYDAIDESSFDAADPSANSNDHHICVGSNTNGTFASLDLETVGAR
ncbi:MAG: parallel beta-helix domain-containing protein, partial [Myxococcota bacterium]